METIIEEYRSFKIYQWKSIGSINQAQADYIQYVIRTDLTGPELTFGHDVYCGSAPSLQEAKKLIDKYISGEELPKFYEHLKENELQ